MRRLAALVLLAAGCSSKRVPEDYWYRHAVMLCQRERCHACGGTRGITCFKCAGDGEVTCDSCGGDGKRACSQCGGDGRYKGNECGDCSGKGTVRCSSCGGDGLETCGTCDGKGKTACLQSMAIPDGPATCPEDAWPPDNFQGSKKMAK